MIPQQTVQRNPPKSNKLLNSWGNKSVDEIRIDQYLN